jgi:hypothetical protein
MGPGADVRREIQREQMAEALCPLTGMNAKEFDVASRRMKLSPEARRKCRQLDGSIAGLERILGRANGAEGAKLQADLLNHRRRYRELRCDA